MKRILVISGGELIGDGLRKIPFLAALRATFPAAHITWFSRQGDTVYASSLRDITQPYLDQVVTKTSIQNLMRTVKGQPFDLTINTQASFSNLLVIKFFLKTHSLFSAAAAYFLSDYKPLPHYQKPSSLVAQLLGYLSIIVGRPIDAPQNTLVIPQDLKDFASSLLPSLKFEGLLPRKTYVGLAPGAGDRKKCWPKAYYIDLVRRLSADNIIPVIFLGPQEQEWVSDFQNTAPNLIFPLQDTKILSSPLQTIAFAQRCAVLITNDCGVGHMFALSGRPLISLFGPTSAKKHAPLTTDSRIITAQEFGGHETSAIPVDVVFQAIQRIITA